MKLSQLIPHTSNWLGIPESQVNTVARVLQPAGLLSIGGRGPGGAEMTVDDKINLLLGVCGVETANRAADHVRIWRRLVRLSDGSDKRFAFLQAKTVRDFFFDLITKDLSGGPLDAWLSQADAALETQRKSAGKNHSVTLDFYVDEFSFEIAVSRYIYVNDRKTWPTLRQSSSDTITLRFIQPAPGGRAVGQPDYNFEQPRKETGYRAPSRLIRRLDAENIRGWGTCLTDTAP
jgi:hypothetical protein